MNKIVFLGPYGATFSHDAYTILAKKYRAPTVTEGNYVAASSNSEVLRLIEEHGGFGALAMETLAGGRLNESLETFICLLNDQRRSKDFGFRVIGAVKLKISFCLMAQIHVEEKQVSEIIAHPKALEACKNRILTGHFRTLNVPSNGEAARLVSLEDKYSRSAALGPKSAAQKYGLKVLNSSFEDEDAFTTFFLIGPEWHKVSIGRNNRILVIFKLKHTPYALVNALSPFARENLNVSQVHSVYCGRNSYHFAIEIELGRKQVASLNKAMYSFFDQVEDCVSFGPFEVAHCAD